MSARKGYKNKAMLQRMWEQVYAAAYVADFHRLRENYGCDALRATRAEGPETVADHAVQEWIRWNEEGR